MPAKSRAGDAAKRAARLRQRQRRSRGSGPAIDREQQREIVDVARHRAVHAQQCRPARALSRGTRPGDGRKPTTLQKLAGLRSEPPRSVPSASGSMPQASATAAPPLLPPQVLREVVRVARRAEHRVEGLRARAELRRVGLADDDRRRRGAGARHRARPDVGTKLR